MEFNYDETEFLCDIKDPPYEPTINKRALRNLPEPETSPKKIRVESISPIKLIFQNQFYTDVKKITYKAKVSTTAQCVGCDRRIKASGDVTSNFIKHLKTKHSEMYAQYISVKLNRPYNNTAQTTFDAKLLHAIIDLTVPVSMLETKSFIDLFETTGMIVMQKQTAVHKLETRYSSMIQKIKDSMSTAKYFYTTAGIWSVNNRRFLGYVCHWLSDDLERKSAVLACKKMLGADSMEKIAQFVTDINAAFGLNSSNIVTTLTDNDTNSVKAFKECGLISNFAYFEADSEDEDENERDQPFFGNELLRKNVRCCSQTLNLLATVDLVKILETTQALYIQHTRVFNQASALWKKCKCPKSCTIIEESLGSPLLVPVVNRWSSLFDAVLNLLQCKDELNDVCDELSLPRFPPADIRYLEMYKLLMEPIAYALNFLQKEENVNYGCLIPTLMTLSNKLYKLSQKQEMQQFYCVAMQLEQRLRERFEPYFMLKPEASIAYAATVLSPDIKMKWLKVLQRSNPNLTEHDISSTVLDSLCSFYAKDNHALKLDDYKSNEVSAESSEYFDFDDEEVDIKPFPLLNKNDQKSKLTNHLFSYLNDNSNAEDIWKKHSVLREPFILFNTPLASSVPVERMFSFVDYINVPKQQSLSDFSIEKLMLLKANNAKWM